LIEYVQIDRPALRIAWVSNREPAPGRRIAVAWVQLDLRFAEVSCWALDVWTLWNVLPATGGLFSNAIGDGKITHQKIQLRTFLAGPCEMSQSIRRFCRNGLLIDQDPDSRAVGGCARPSAHGSRRR
jgi:hypothetical protein